MRNMGDLFDRTPPTPGGFGDHRADGYYRPEPWKGCDTMSRAWLDYCEAWTLYHRLRDDIARDAYLISIARFRSKVAAAALKHNIGVVEQDMQGLIKDRTRLEAMLQ